MQNNEWEWWEANEQCDQNIQAIEVEHMGGEQQVACIKMYRKKGTRNIEGHKAKHARLMGYRNGNQLESLI
jgi:hypothetical protein